MKITKIMLALGAITLLGFSSAPQAVAQREAAVARANKDDIKVTVLNRNWLDVRVYAVSSSHVVRLGTVSGFGEQTFVLPRTVGVYSDIQLAVRPIGQRGVHYSMPLLASPGDTIEFRIENHLALSSAIVY